MKMRTVEIASVVIFSMKRWFKTAEVPDSADWKVSGADVEALEAGATRAAPPANISDK